MLKQIPQSPSQSLPGIENYTLIRQVGEGGYGFVYEAQQLSTGQKVAIKMLKINDEDDTQKRKFQIARFERETQLCAELNHPHIVKLLDKGYTSEQAPYAVFEYVEGLTLKDLVMSQSGLTPALTGDLMGQILDALAAAHAKGIVHRDLKPHNIMVTEAGSKSHVKILDFGIGAFTRDFRTNEYQSLTLTREVLGTPAYSAPEQLRGEPATPKSDLYAWGLSVLECLTGVPVMKGDSVAEVFQMQLDAANVPLPPAIVGHPLADLLRRVLNKNVRLRAGDAKALYQEFSQFNFNTLVGKIQPQAVVPTLQDTRTEVNPLEWQGIQSEIRQVTVDGVKLSMTVLDPHILDQESRETLFKDAMNQIQDISIRYGAHFGGRLGNQMSFYFGYPKVSDNDARRAGRAALEIMGEIRNRNGIFEEQHGIRLQVQIGMHTGAILVKPNQVPEGGVLNQALDLLNAAQPGNILISEASKKLLDPYLEFEAVTPPEHLAYALPNSCFHIKGERQTEALSFLRPWSANREMIGRDTERNTVLNHWETVRNGTGQSLILHGQAGIGKSKMIYEIKKQVRSEGFQLRECRCLPENQNNALFPFLNMLRNHWELAEQQDSACMISRLETVFEEMDADAGQGIPILCSWLSIPLHGDYQPSQATPDVQKQILFDVLQKAILHIGQKKAFLLVLEDLHWLDPTGREFVEFLLTNLTSQAYLLLMTTRPVFVPEWKAGHLFDVQLEPLAEEAIKTLVEGVLEEKSIADQALTYIVERADGIPLYIEELTRMLVEEKYLIQEGDIYILNEATDIQDIPSTLQDLLNARLDRIGLGKETAQIAAAIGREFNYELLVRASLRDEASVQGDLESLMDADLIYRQRRVQDDGYIFRHALIRDAAYEGMVAGARKEHHGRIAGTLKRDFPEVVEENPFEVGRHLAGAEEFEEGSEYGIKTIQKMTNRSSNKEATNTGSLVAEWILKIPAEITAAKLRLKLNQNITPAYMITEGLGSHSAYKINQENVALIEKHGEKGLGVTLVELSELKLAGLWSSFNHHLAKGQVAESLKFAEEVLEECERTNNLRQEAAYLPMFGHAYHCAGDYNKAYELLNRCIDLCENNSFPGIEKDASFVPMGFAYACLGHLEQWMGKPITSNLFYDKAIFVANEIGHATSLSWFNNYRFSNGFYHKRPNEILHFEQKFLEDYKNLQNQENQDEIEYDGWQNIYCQLARGITESPLERIRQYVKTDNIYAVDFYYIHIVDGILRQGDLDLAMEVIEECVAIGRKSEGVWTIPMRYRMYAIVKYLSTGEFTSEIEDYLAEGLRVAEKMEAEWWVIEILCTLIEMLEKDKRQPFWREKLMRSMEKFEEGKSYHLYRKAEQHLERSWKPLSDPLLKYIGPFEF